jgi:hypothetical protein
MTVIRLTNGIDYWAFVAQGQTGMQQGPRGEQM